MFGPSSDAVNRALISASKDILKAAFPGKTLDKTESRSRCRIDFRAAEIFLDGEKVIERGFGDELVWLNSKYRPSSTSSA